MANLINGHVGARIRMRRLMIGMSQKELGEQVGITFQQIQKYEKGTNQVGSGRLYEIGRALHVPISFFFEGQEGTAPSDELQPAMVDDLLLSKDSLQLLKAFNDIPDPSARQSLANIARALANKTVQG